MPINDEPVLGPAFGDSGPDGRDAVPLAERIRHLVTRQRYAVLCTQGEGQAYGSLVAFSFSDDLRTAVFARNVQPSIHGLLSSL